MIDLMEKNKDFACATANGREHFRKLWKELTTKLNTLGYRERPVEKWQKSWADYESNLKKKASQLKKWQGQTGGGPELNKKLSDLELRVLDILGTIFFEGCGNKEVALEHLEQNRSTEMLQTGQENSPKSFMFDTAQGKAYYSSSASCSTIGIHVRLFN
ncbi:unnamed protein product [Ceutorhynchus assimilis]|uniref:Regulatory protein zeste n=1 Tax=Ceutorhynchus assimilis TaxID=467358 RepID=A0A9N9QSY7_9CUCU|nr:unnamed protein product [Ceutorhynchus assimilis]